MCCGFTSIKSKRPSKTFHTGFQYTPVASITTWVTLCSASHAAISPSSPVKVPKRRSSFSSLRYSRIITHAEMLFLCTSSPQHRECNTSIHTFLLDAASSRGKERNSTCSLVAESHNSFVPLRGRVQTLSRVRNPSDITLSTSDAHTHFIPCCGLEKAMCNSIRSDPGGQNSAAPQQSPTGSLQIES